MTNNIGLLEFCEETKDENDEDLKNQLSVANAVDRVRIIVDNFGDDSVTVLTSFGVQSGVMLALGESLLISLPSK